MSSAGRKIARRLLAQDVTEAYDEICRLLETAGNVAPEHFGDLERARDLLFGVRVQLEDEEQVKA